MTQDKTFELIMLDYNFFLLMCVHLDIPWILCRDWCYSAKIDVHVAEIVLTFCEPFTVVFFANFPEMCVHLDIPQRLHGYWWYSAEIDVYATEIVSWTDLYACSKFGHISSMFSCGWIFLILEQVLVNVKSKYIWFILFIIISLSEQFCCQQKGK